MKLSVSKTILAVGVLFLLAVSITDARQRGGPQQPGALPKLTKVRDDIYLIENSGQTVTEIGTYGGNITLVLTDEGVIAVDSKSVGSISRGGGDSPRSMSQKKSYVGNVEEAAGDHSAD